LLLPRLPFPPQTRRWNLNLSLKPIVVDWRTDVFIWLISAYIIVEYIFIINYLSIICHILLFVFFYFDSTNVFPMLSNFFVMIVIKNYYKITNILVENVVNMVIVLFHITILNVIVRTNHAFSIVSPITMTFSLFILRKNINR
jgi:hypothetical protein